MTIECMWCSGELRRGDRGYCSDACRQAHRAHARARARPVATDTDDERRTR